MCAEQLFFKFLKGFLRKTAGITFDKHNTNKIRRMEHKHNTRLTCLHSDNEDMLASYPVKLLQICDLYL